MAESRYARQVYYVPRPAGRTTVGIECPFCGCAFEAILWSLAGSGKCCPDCGALHSRDNQFGDVAAITRPMGSK